MTTDQTEHLLAAIHDLLAERLPTRGEPRPCGCRRDVEPLNPGEAWVEDHDPEPDYPAPCANCGTAYDACTVAMRDRNKCCCGSCAYRITHDQDEWEEWNRRQPPTTTPEPESVTVTLPRVACICGSTRQRQDMTDLNRRLTMEGKIVLAPGVFGHDGDPLTDEDKERLDALHFAKIDMADEVHFIAKPDGSLGASTTREYDHAKATGKQIVNHKAGDVPAPPAAHESDDQPTEAPEDGEGAERPTGANLAIEGTWLVREVGHCTCSPYGSSHEPGCGLEPEVDLATLPGWPRVLGEGQVAVDMRPGWRYSTPADWREEAKILRKERPDALAAAALCEQFADALDGEQS